MKINKNKEVLNDSFGREYPEDKKKALIDRVNKGDINAIKQFHKDRDYFMASILYNSPNTSSLNKDDIHKASMPIDIKGDGAFIVKDREKYWGIYINQQFIFDSKNIYPVYMNHKTKLVVFRRVL